MSRRTWITLLIVVVAAMLVSLALLGVILAVRHEPAFYRAAMELDSARLEKGSFRMVQQATALTSAVEKPGRWEALFTAEQINGWLAVDLIRNHPKALPAGWQDPRVTIDAGQVTLACRYQRGDYATVLNLTLKPSVPEPNVIALRILKVRAGLLPAPIQQVTDRLTKAAADMGCPLRWHTVGGDPVALITLPAAANRPIRLETLRLGDGEIYVAGSTQAKKP